ncbi:hypothetical protein GKJPGBOP_02056 [Streptomyces paromomycinus]|uniref:Uncharacterized protein n=1 Tax=Streptomyces paromomycinus TaxID=92743 RepID=A0A401VZB0_STREY|nr:hypothetical protein GKJPGBOP_02056 [Streptomyces paromomycinus]
MRRRVEGLQRSSASIALFMEYIPRTLHDWLTDQVQADEAAADRACRETGDRIRTAWPGGTSRPG